MSSIHFSLSIEKLSTEQVYDFISLRVALRAGDQERAREILGAAFFRVVEAPFNKSSDSHICTLYWKHIAPNPARKRTVKLFETSIMMMEMLNNLRTMKAPLWMGGGKPEALFEEIEPYELTINSGLRLNEWSLKLIYSCGDEAPIKMFVLAQAFYEAGWPAEPDLNMQRVEL